MTHSSIKAKINSTDISEATLGPTPVEPYFWIKAGNIPPPTPTMSRDNKGKPRLGLIHPSFYRTLMATGYPVKKARPLLEEIAKVLEFGYSKYGEYNWLKGGSWMKVVDSAIRHLLTKDQNDKESDLPHLAHFACNLMFLIEFSTNSAFEEWDDRPCVRGEWDYPFTPSCLHEEVFADFLLWVTREGSLETTLYTTMLWFEEYHNADE